MTLIFENMIKNSKIMLKMRFLELKCAQNGISKFDMPIYFYVKNRQKNVADAILFRFSIFGHYMSKLIDQPEISGAPRASNQQHLSKP